MTSVLYHLAKNAEVRHTLEQEIATAIAEGRASNPITYAEAIKLPYMYAVPPPLPIHLPELSIAPPLLSHARLT